MRDYNRTRFYCPCGSIICISARYTHFKTIKHRKFNKLKKLTNELVVIF